MALRLSGRADPRSGDLPHPGTRGTGACQVLRLAGPGRKADGGFPRRPECRDLEACRIHDPDGTGGADAGRDASDRLRLLPRFKLASGAGAAPSGFCRAVRVGLPDPVGAGPEIARRPVGDRPRLHRSPCLVRGVHPRRGLDRAGPDIGASDGRKPYPAGRDAALRERRPHRGRLFLGRHAAGRFRLRHAGEARVGTSAHHQTLFGRGVGAAEQTRTAGRRESGKERRAPHDGRRADVRVDRRFRERRVEHRRRRPAEACARGSTDPPPARPFRTGGLSPLRARKVVSGRKPAALDLLALLAARRQTRLA